MLPSDLLMHRYNGEEVVPKRLELDKKNLELAAEIIDLFAACQGKKRAELDESLLVLEGEATNYRVKRGLAHLLSNGFCTFETVSPIEPELLRERIFALSAKHVPAVSTTDSLISGLAAVLSEELGKDVDVSQVQEGLYADLKENAILTTYEPPSAEALLHRYNLSQVQGILYRAKELVIHAHRNVPGEYKQLFRYLKLFGLMTYIEGDVDHGFSVTIDGPASVFGSSTRYGTDIAKFLPALLNVSKWSMEANLLPRQLYDGSPAAARFTLDSDCGLVSHYKRGKVYDSMVEEAFAKRWESTKTDWVLEREVNLLPIPGSVMVPDFRLVHPDGRDFVLEIVGYWRPEYLKKKFAQVARSGINNLILAVSQKLNLEKAGVKVENVLAKVIWFKEKIIPKDVLALID
ncbi:MAG: DUF790 family protein [Trueperaceae bacterium]|nr:DUF790 family protein [Trueperaceae bacterium]